jgi:hypothetical protein
VTITAQALSSKLATRVTQINAIELAGGSTFINCSGNTCYFQNGSPATPTIVGIDLSKNLLNRVAEINSEEIRFLGCSSSVCYFRGLTPIEIIGRDLSSKLATRVTQINAIELNEGVTFIGCSGNTCYFNSN